LNQAQSATLALCLAFGALGEVAFAETSAEPVRRALVIAFNGAPEPRLSPLRFADDDGVLWADALERLGVSVTLLTIPDADTARLNPRALSGARAPTLAAVQAAATAIGLANARDRAAGRSSDAFLVYVGHGATDEAGRAYLTLLDAHLERAALFSDVVDALGADYTHLLIDACRAAGVVGPRGDRVVLEAVRNRLEAEALQNRPTVGAIFGESEDGEAHEWSKLRAGVFSHAARSALLGAADVNGDGVLEYSEVDAFIASAFAGVDLARAKMSVRTLPPVQQPRRPLVGPVPAGPRLRVPSGPNAFRLAIDDAHDVRLLDFHLAENTTAQVALPMREVYWIRTSGGERRVGPSELEGDVFVQREEAEERLSSRGPVEEGLQIGMFSVPYGRAFYEGYLASTGVVGVSFNEVREVGGGPGLSGRKWGIALLGMQSGLGRPAMALGLTADVGWRVLPWFWLGARSSYAVAPRAWLDGSEIHRLALLAVASGEAAFRWRPFVELGLGASALLLSGKAAVRGDVPVPTAQLTVGVHSPTWPSVVLSLFAIVDAPRIDGVRRLMVAPGFAAGASF
jgi:hypothetical protein